MEAEAGTGGEGEDDGDLVGTPNRDHQNITPNDITDKMMAMIDSVSAVPQLSFDDDDDDDSLCVCVMAEAPVEDMEEDAAVEDEVVVVVVVVGGATIVTEGEVSAPAAVASV